MEPQAEQRTDPGARDVLAKLIEELPVDAPGFEQLLIRSATPTEYLVKLYNRVGTDYDAYQIRFE